MVDALSPGTFWDGARGHSYCSAIVILEESLYKILRARSAQVHI